jgi:hypothetical protein
VSIRDREPSLDALLLTPIVIEWENHLWSNETMAVARAHTPLGLYGGYQRVAADMYFDLEELVKSLVMADFRAQFDYGLRPWSRTDPPAFPRFDLFTGRVGRLLDWIDRRRR